MSTKIYNAYEWTGTIDELMVFLKEYRKFYLLGLEKFLLHLPYIQKLADSTLLDNYIHFIDRVNDELVKASRSMERNPLAFDASVTVIFHKGRIFVKQFGFDGLFRPEFEHPQLEDFHYQNQVDAPEDIPEGEFEARGRVWDEILDASETSSFAEIGLNYDFLGEMDIWRIAFKLGTEFYRRKKNEA